MNINERLAYLWLTTKGGYKEYEVSFSYSRTPDFIAYKDNVSIGYEVKTAINGKVILSTYQLVDLLNLKYAFIMVFLDDTCKPVLMPVKMIEAGFYNFNGIHIRLFEDTYRFNNYSVVNKNTKEIIYKDKKGKTANRLCHKLGKEFYEVVYNTPD